MRTPKENLSTQRYQAPLALFPPQNYDVSQETTAVLQVVLGEKCYINTVPILSTYRTVFESWERANKVAD
jgi:hypothetical protein